MPKLRQLKLKLRNVMQSVSNLLKEHREWKKKTIEFLKTLNNTDLNLVVGKYRILRIDNDTLRTVDLLDGSHDVWKMDVLDSNILEEILCGIENMFNVVKKIM